MGLSYLKSKPFWVAATERAIRAFAETLTAILTAAVVSTFAPAVDFDFTWHRFDVWLVVSLMAGVLSFLTSLSAGAKSSTTSLLAPTPDFVAQPCDDEFMGKEKETEAPPTDNFHPDNDDPAGTVDLHSITADTGGDGVDENEDADIPDDLLNEADNTPPEGE